MVTQVHTHEHILFLHMIMLHHKWPDIVPRATEQDLIADPVQRQEFASINPELRGGGGSGMDWVSVFLFFYF